ncbi:MAG: SDR family oxidoreductase [Phycisphaeraceae bacterium]|nr:SDR family oxidoreductase [Phycisphaeraceae bacterium]
MGVVLITGANRGIGLELARQMAARGRKVIGTARRPEEAAELQKVAKVIALDVADEASVEGMAREVGDEAVDVLFNNAGVSSKSPKLEVCTKEELTRVLAINSIGPVLVTKALLGNVRKGERKLVVNVTSQLGSIARNEGGSYGYRASKAALNMFTSCMAKEHKDVTFIAMHPGWVQTDMGGKNAPLKVEESVSSMLLALERVGTADSGSFLNFDGTTIPW